MFSGALGQDYGISRDSLEKSCICPVTARRPLQVVDLTTGPMLRRLSPRADNRISDGSYGISQRWARALWAHPDQPDGILYRCRHSPERLSLALFDRVAPELIATGIPNLLQDPRRLGELLDYFDCALV